MEQFKIIEYPAGWREKLSMLWAKLPNSGDPLKLLVLNHNWKIVCGWINYSWKVISQKMMERKMGNLGSKSLLDLHLCWWGNCWLVPRWFTSTQTGLPASLYVAQGVKEQRVNGSYYINKKKSNVFKIYSNRFRKKFFNSNLT